MIGQLQSASIELHLQNAVFLDQVVNNVLLLAIEPSREGS